MVKEHACAVDLDEQDVPALRRSIVLQDPVDAVAVGIAAPACFASRPAQPGLPEVDCGQKLEVVNGDIDWPVSVVAAIVSDTFGLKDCRRASRLVGKRLQRLSRKEMELHGVVAHPMALFRVFELHSLSILGRRSGPGFRELDVVRAVEMVFGDAEGSFGSFSQHAPGFPAGRLEKDVEAWSSQDADKKLLLGGLNVLGVDCGHARVRISGGLQVLHRHFAPPCEEVVNDFDQTSLELHRHVAASGLDVRVFLNEGFSDFGNVFFQKLLENLNALVGGIRQRQTLDSVLLTNPLHDLHFDSRRLDFAHQPHRELQLLAFGEIRVLHLAEALLEGGQAGLKGFDVRVVAQDAARPVGDFGRHEVVNFLLANALFWCDRFHIDGLRVDAVASMLYLDYSRQPGQWIPNQYGGRENLEAIDFIRKFNHLTHTEFPGVMTIAEESTAWPHVTRPPYVGGLGFSFKWNMGWMHDTLLYFSHDPVHRKYHQNDLTFAMLYHHHENFILPLSHDEVVHGKRSLLGRMPGDDWRRFANLRTLLGYQWLFPGKKLLFMGGEFGQSDEWNANSELQWELLEAGPYHRGLQRLVEDLNKLYLAEPALWKSDYDLDGFHWIDNSDHANSVLLFRSVSARPAAARRGPQQAVLGGARPLEIRLRPGWLPLDR